MKKVLSVVGTRPNIIKLAAITPHLKEGVKHIILHTGQHYDENMSRNFFEDLNLPMPDYNLEIGSASHAQMTAKVLAKGERIFQNEKPDLVLIYGDVNSSLAAAIICAKLNIPIAHIESGMRSFDKKMPEEINRIIIDHISSLLFCSSKIGVTNLKNEGISKGVYFVGDTMFDVFLKTKKEKEILETLSLLPKEYYYCTIHRQENTQDLKILFKILNSLNSLDKNVVIPAHPRLNKLVKNTKQKFKNIKFINPVSYSYNISLIKYSKLVLTDSGGIQKEAFWLKVPCITLRNSTEWPETVILGWNTLAGNKLEKIKKLVKSAKTPKTHKKIYGSGNSGLQIATIIKNWLS